VKVGFVVNPIAGMGGAVGLKGTDGDKILREALARGAERVSSQRAEIALRAIKDRGLKVEFVTCSGDMGHKALESVGLKGEVVCRTATPSTSEDTVKAAKAFLTEKVDLILFAGGDGTARDLLGVVGQQIPLIGIPSGVKKHSAVFAMTPDDVAGSMMSFCRAGKTREAEVMDVDEDRFRGGVLQAKLFGYAAVPDDADHVQSSKMTYHSGSAQDEREELGQYVSESIEEGIMYIMGPGSTTESVAKSMGLKKTLLGVDIYKDCDILAEDVSESKILELLGLHRYARIIVSPIGAQGFILGRGNQQLSPRVLRKVGLQNLVVISTPTKLRSTPVLRVDTGDPELDESIRGRIKVLTGYKRKKLARVQ